MAEKLHQVEEGLHVAFGIDFAGQVGLRQTEEIGVQDEITQRRRTLKRQDHGCPCPTMGETAVPQPHRDRPLVAFQQGPHQAPPGGDIRGRPLAVIEMPQKSGSCHDGSSVASKVLSISRWGS